MLRQKRLVISLDGGGPRGGIVASFLKELTRTFFNGDLCKHVDAMAGNSAGAIIVGCLASGVSAATISDELFTERNLSPLFVRTWSSSVPLLGRLATQYDSGKKLKQIQRFIPPSETMDSARHRMLTVIPTYNWTRRSVNLFHNFGHAGSPHASLSDVVHASSSPPYFFSGHHVDTNDVAGTYQKSAEEENHHHESYADSINGVFLPVSGDLHLDGGIGVNTPDTVLLAMAQREWPDDDIYMISIGTGYDAEDDGPNPDFSSNVFGLLWSGMFSQALRSPNETNAINSALLSGHGRYIRIEHALPKNFDMSLDRVDNDHVEQLKLIGQTWFRRNHQRLQKFLRQLEDQ